VNLESAKAVFFEETDEQLAAMEGALLAIESDGGEQRDELLNSLFRAAHTIKGSAGLFDFADIVAFTHVVESVLDRLRSAQIAVSADLLELLLACRDHIGALAVATRDGQARPSAPDLKKRLEEYLSAEKKAAPPPPPAAAAPMPAIAAPSARPTLELDNPTDHMVASEFWHISLRFGPDVLRNGMDPMSFIRYLGSIGRIRYLTTLFDALPAPDDMDPESCYLGFEIEFESSADKQTIENVFEFVRDDSAIRILPPHSKVAEYIRLITELPEGSDRIGQILLKGGAITANELAEMLALQRDRAAGGDTTPLGTLMVEENLIPAQAVMAALDLQRQHLATQKVEHRAVRVDAARLDRLIDLVGELVISGAGTQLIAAGTGNTLLVEAISTLSGLVEQIRDEALSLRMVPIGEIFGRFPRVVRDASRELAKDIVLEIDGEETELDKSMVERLSDPLTHLVRNALDHGIESPAKRLAAGKSEQGVLWLNAFHESGSVVVEVGDDGGGIDRERVRVRAIERGLIKANAVLSDYDTLQLIFEPGFSTAETVTNLSGRGVGMDVVKRNIESLKGVIDIDSVLGEGTVVRLRVPLTLAIIDGFQVDVGNSPFVIPLDMVIECLDLPISPGDSEARYLDLRGEVLPYIRLREVFEIEARDVPPPRSLRENVVVVQYGKDRAGLVVDRLHGELQAVIKPLGQLFRGIKGLGGSTILGSGAVALILDVPALIGLAAGAERRRVLSAPGRKAVVAATADLALPHGVSR